ncbi:MAG: protein disulfide oxidoreductase [candidate division WOR-3 bacterium]
MAIISENDSKALSEFFKESLKDSVALVFFNSKSSQFGNDVEALLREVSALSDKIDLEVHDFDLEREKANGLGLEYAPSIALIKEGKGLGILFTGAPFGYEFSSLIEAIKMASSGNTELEDDVREKVRTIDKSVRIKVFVTPSCPYCPRAVVIAHRFAYENENIVGEMIEAQEFPEIAQLYNVYAVPKVVINEKVEFEGALPEKQFLEYLMEALG